MQYISLYTVPAWKDSLNTFDDFWYYFFDDSDNSKFKFNKINEACYLGLWREYEINTLWLDYLKIQKIWKIAKVWKFIIDYNEDEIIKFSWDKSDNIDEVFKKHFDCFHRYSTWKIKNDTPKKWIYIYIEDNIIDINEDILYPSKDLVSISLNLDWDWNYINSFKLIDSLKISDNTFFNFTNKNLIVNWEVIEINPAYWKIIELIFRSENKNFNIYDNKKYFVNHIKWFTYSDLKSNTQKWFNTTLQKYLDFKIIIYPNWIVQYAKR